MTESSIRKNDARAHRFLFGTGSIVLDLIRTVFYRRSESLELLREPQDLDAWIAGVGLAPLLGPRGADPEALRRVRNLREAIYRLVIAASEKRAFRGHDRAVVNRAATGEPPIPSLNAAGAVAWKSTLRTRALLALVARDAIYLLTSKRVERVRECASEKCTSLFFDDSRPGTRRWCSMNVCGNRAKKETLRRTDPVSTRGRRK